MTLPALEIEPLRFRMYDPTEFDPETRLAIIRALDELERATFPIQNGGAR